jgi:GDP-4-dehydro-6-deoxy-D-mannose reductase
VRVLVTGASGFAGQWLVRELKAAGHVALPAPRGADDDIWNVEVVRHNLDEAQPDAVAHLAAVSFGPDAAADPERAMQTNVGGTEAMVEAIARVNPGICLLVASSSEVYGPPDPADLPLREDAALRATAPYGLSKLAQENVALQGAARFGIRVAVTRAFNHTGPGQRPMFAAPAFARRILAVKAGQATTIPAGNVDVRRDLGDVRDVVVAYRLVLELLRDGGVTGPLVVNVATGHAVAIRDVIQALSRAAGIDAPIEVDPALVRQGDPLEIRGDASLLRGLTGWRPTFELEQTLQDLLANVADEAQGYPAAATSEGRITRAPPS